MVRLCCCQSVRRTPKSYRSCNPNLPDGTRRLVAPQSTMDGNERRSCEMNLTAPWNATNGHTNGTHDKIEDVRNVLSREADHLAEVAAQFGREATAHADVVARDVARDAQKQTNAAVGRLADVAAAWGPTIAAMGRKRMQQASEQAQSLGHDLRQVRITTEPKRNDATSNIAIVGGLGIGLGLGMAAMYLL